MESILAFCAASVSPIRRGKANWPICMSWMVLLGCCRTDTLTILLSFTTSWIWTGPEIELATLPVTVCSSAGRPVCFPVANPWPPEVDPPKPDPDDPEPEPDPEPDVPPDDTPVPLAAATAGTCDLNDRRATRPAMVAVTARMARRISVVLLSELERFEVDVPLGHAGGLERLDRGRCHAGRAADVDVVPLKAGHQRAQHPRGQRVPAELGARPDQVVHGRAARRRDGVEFLAEHEVALTARTVDQGDRTGQGREHGAQRGDADPAGQQQHAPLRAPGGERAERALGHHPGTRSQAGQRLAVIAEVLDRDPQHALARRGGQRIRVRRPPQGPGEEPPAEELAGLGRKLLQMGAADVDRGHARPFGLDPDHLEAVPVEREHRDH